MASPYKPASPVGSSGVYADSLVVQLTSRTRAAVIARSTVDPGRNLGLRVAAEGVEHHATW